MKPAYSGRVCNVGCRLESASNDPVSEAPLAVLSDIGPRELSEVCWAHERMPLGSRWQGPPQWTRFIGIWQLNESTASMEVRHLLPQRVWLGWRSTEREFRGIEYRGFRTSHVPHLAKANPLHSLHPRRHVRTDILEASLL